MKKIEIITEDSFRAYGKVIRFPEGDRSNFYIVDNDSDHPWRLAVYRYSNHSIKRIECHPASKESFEPLAGTTLLLAAAHGNPEDYHIFLLDRPVILDKGVWHQTLALTEEAQVKITENLEVESVFYDLREEIGIYAVGKA